MNAQPLVSASTFDLCVIYGSLAMLAFLAIAHLWERGAKRRKRNAWRGILKDYKPRADERDSIKHFRRVIP